jgi:hypothetical protein
MPLGHIPILIKREHSIEEDRSALANRIADSVVFNNISDGDDDDDDKIIYVFNREELRFQVFSHRRV